MYLKNNVDIYYFHNEAAVLTRVSIMGLHFYELPHNEAELIHKFIRRMKNE